MLNSDNQLDDCMWCVRAAVARDDETISLYVSFSTDVDSQHLSVPLGMLSLICRSR
jgi:hypothetical protein